MIDKVPAPAPSVPPGNGRVDHPNGSGGLLDQPGVQRRTPVRRRRRGDDQHQVVRHRRPGSRPDRPGPPRPRAGRAASSMIRSAPVASDRGCRATPLPPSTRSAALLRVRPVTRTLRSPGCDQIGGHREAHRPEADDADGSGPSRCIRDHSDVNAADHRENVFNPVNGALDSDRSSRPSDPGREETMIDIADRLRVVVATPLAEELCELDRTTRAADRPDPGPVPLSADAPSGRLRRGPVVLPDARAAAGVRGACSTRPTPSTASRTSTPRL